jgi:hypothetical protein
MDENKTKHAFYVSQLFSENRALYEIMWKNIVELDRQQMTTWRVCIACWIPTSKITPNI